MLTLTNSLQDSLTEGLQRIKIILQTSKQLFGDHDDNSGDESSRSSLPLLFDGRTFLLQEPPAVTPTSNTPTDTTKTAEVSNYFINLVLEFVVQVQFKMLIVIRDDIWYSCIHQQEEVNSDSDSDSVIIDDDNEDQGDMVTHHGAKEQGLLSDIEKLRIEKEQLTRRLQDQQQTKQDIEV